MGQEVVFMIGMLIWDRAGHGLRPARMKEISVLHVRFLCVSSCPVGSAALSLLSAILRQPFLALLFQTSQTLFFRLFRFIKLFS